MTRRAAALALDRTRRVRDGRTFGNVIRRGVRAADRLLHVWAAPAPAAGTRLGIVVSRRHGNAVARNRLKRIVREAFRHVRARLPEGIDVIVRPQIGQDLERDTVAESLERLAARAAALLARRAKARP